MDLFVSGDDVKNGATFTFKIDSKVVLEIINLVEDNEDMEAEIMLAKMDRLKASIYDALTYIRDIEQITNLLKTGTRFAYMFGDINFGVSGTSYEDAREALDLHEF